MDSQTECARALRALAQPVRLSIVSALAGGELCVCELERVLGMTQPAVSQHLKVLRAAGLVTERREGQWALQSLNTAALERVLATVATVARGGGGLGLSEACACRLAQVRAKPLIDCPRQLRP